MNLPRYQCHKVVEAGKITNIELIDNSGAFELTLRTDVDGGEVHTVGQLVSDAYVHKHKPEVGGYYVRYADGYESFSPAEAFEDGYTLIEDEPDTPDDPPASAPEPEKQTPWKDLLFATLCGFLLGLTAALIFWCYASTRPDTVAQEKTPEPPKAEALAKAADALERAGQPIWRDCLKVDLLAVTKPAIGQGFWYFQAHNGCIMPTPRLYVRLAFYDTAGFRHGFASTTVETLQPGEFTRLEQPVPREGAWSARVMDVTTDALEALKWL